MAQGNMDLEWLFATTCKKISEKVSLKGEFLGSKTKNKKRIFKVPRKEEKEESKGNV